MSHRVTTKSEIKDAELAESALKQAGFSFDRRGNSILITSGELHGATINLQTGDIQGDSDYGHRADRFGALRQFYSEAKVKKEMAKNAGYVEERSVDQQGNIILMAVFN
jgi:hypothetical protein